MMHIVVDREYISYGEKMTSFSTRKLSTTWRGKFQFMLLYELIYIYWLGFDCDHRQLGDRATLQYIEKAGHLVEAERPCVYNKHLKEILATLLEDGHKKQWSLWLICHPLCTSIFYYYEIVCFDCTSLCTSIVLFVSSKFVFLLQLEIFENHYEYVLVRLYNGTPKMWAVTTLSNTRDMANFNLISSIHVMLFFNPHSLPLWAWFWILKQKMRYWSGISYLRYWI